MLNSHPEIAAYSELFLEGAEGRPTWGGRKDVVFWHTYLRAKQERAENARLPDLLCEYLDEQLYEPRNGIRAVGFKLMYGQAAAYPALVDYLATRQVSMLHLIRRNTLRIVLSKELAVQRDQFHARVDDSVKRTAVRLNAKNLVEELFRQETEVKKARTQFSALRLPYLEVVYEDLLSGATPFDVLLSFLGMQNGMQALTSTLQRLNVAPLSELIENYEEVRQALAGTRFLDLLTADR